MDNHNAWALASVFMVAMICGTLLYMFDGPFTFRFESDDNTRDVAMKWAEAMNVDCSALEAMDCQFYEKNAYGCSAGNCT